MRYASRDPLWITARYDGNCRRCGRLIDRGARAFWYPNGRTLYCDTCGLVAEANFRAAAADEAAYGHL